MMLLQKFLESNQKENNKNDKEINKLIAVIAYN